MPSPSFVSPLPLHSSPTSAAPSTNTLVPTHSRPNPRRPRSRSRSHTPSHRRPHATATHVPLLHAEETSPVVARPTPADWLRANESTTFHHASSNDALRLACASSSPSIHSMSPSVTIPVAAATAAAQTSGQSRGGASAARVAPPSRSFHAVVPFVTSPPKWLCTSPPSYCNIGTDLTRLVADLETRVSYLGPVARNKVVRAVELARASGISDPSLADNVMVALLVADLQMDCECICAAVLRTIVGRPGCREGDVEHEVGADVLTILTLHAQLEESVRLCVDASFTELSFANLRELILVRAMEEHRVISLELARAVLAIRTVDALPDEESRLAVARRTMYLYAPLANQLGIWFVQSELEELAFMYLEPESFDMIRHLVGERRRECEDMLASSKEFLERVFSRTPEVRNLIRTVRIKGRVKGLYSVYRKMKRSGKKVFEIYDLLALRVIVQPKKADDAAERAACYAIAEVIKRHFDSFESRGKDYIAKPKLNGYRSVHLTVLPHGGSTPLEIQVRTEKMHHVAEFGAAAHWIYKEKHADDDSDNSGGSGGSGNGNGSALVALKERKTEVACCKASFASVSGPSVRHTVVPASKPVICRSDTCTTSGGGGVALLPPPPRSNSSSNGSTGSTDNMSYPRPRIPVEGDGRQAAGKQAEERLKALARERLSMRRRVGGHDDLQREMRGGYVTCLASAIRASRVIVAAAGQLYGLAIGSTLMDLASGLGVASLGAIAVVNGTVAPLTQRLEMNDFVRFIQI